MGRKSLLLANVGIAFTFTTATGALVPAVAHAADSAAAPAADADSSSADTNDIVVTASRRETKLQDTPIAVSAFGEKTLDQRNIRSVRDLAGSIPNFQTSRAALINSAQTFNIRGIGEGDPLQEPAVSIYVDDVYMPRPLSSNLEFADAERVEVLRGAQGTSYGRNSSGGAVVVTTHTPTDKLEAKASVAVGNYKALDARAVLSGPIADGLYASIAAQRRSREGSTKNPTLGHRVNNIDIWGVRGKLRWVSGDFEALLAADFTRDYSDAAMYTPITPPAGKPYDPYTSYGEVEPLNQFKGGGGSLKAVWKASDDTELKSVTSVRGFHDPKAYFEIDGLPDLFGVNYVLYDDKSVSEELTLSHEAGDIRLTAGAFYIHDRFKLIRDGFNRTGSTLAAPVAANQAFNITTTDAYAVYGEAEWKATDKFTLTGGLRGTIEKKVFSFNNKVLDLNRNVIGQSIAGEPQHTWRALTPKLVARYAWSRDVSTYASFAQGFKAGNYDNRAVRLDVAQTPTNPEKVSTFEIGAKTQAFDRKLQANVAVFYNDYKNLQTSFYDPGYSTSRRGNAGQAETYGAELETSLNATKELSLQFSAGYLHAIYKKYEGVAGLGTNANGNKLAVPEWTLSAGAIYGLPLGTHGTLQFQGEWQYQSSYFASALNRPVDLVSPQTWVNGSISWLVPGDRWTVAFQVRNLLKNDKALSQTVQPQLGYAFQTVNPPRTALIRVSYSF